MEESKRKSQDQLAEETLAECHRVWGPFMEAMGSPMKAAYAKGLPSAPRGWIAPDPAALGEALRGCLLEQLKSFGESVVAPSAWDDYDGRRALQERDRQCSSLMFWALSEASGAGAFEQAVAAVEAAHGEAFIADPEPGRRALIQAAANTSWAETPSDAARRINQLGAADLMWRSDSPWETAARGARGEWYDAFGRDKERRVGWDAAKLVKAAELRHECAEAALKAIKAMVALEGDLAWGAMGEKAGESLSNLYARADRVPEALYSGLPIEFWLGVKSELTGSSKLGAELLKRALAAGKADGWARDQACLLAWSGLEKKEIDAFEAVYPGESGACLRRALNESLRIGDEGFRGGYALGTLLEFRLSAAAKRASGKWAAALASPGERGDPVSIRMGGFRGPEATELFDGLMALRESDLLRREVKEAKALRLAEAEAKGEPAPKRAKKPKAKGL